MSVVSQTMRQTMGHLQLIVAALVLAGCTNLAPRHERPASPIPAQLPLPAEAAASASAAAAVPLGWKAFVQSPQLAQLVQRALDQNRDLRVAVLNVQRAEAQLGVARADRLPTVSAGLTAAATPNASSGRQTQSFTAGVQVTAWELDLFGRIANLGEAAQAQVLATEAGRRSAELALVGAVVSGWLTRGADAELLSVADRTLASRESTLKLSKLTSMPVPRRRWSCRPPRASSPRPATRRCSCAASTRWT